MRLLLNKALATYRQDGFYVLCIRTWRYLLVKIKRCLSPKDHKNESKWNSLKGRYRGKRIFILGNGPSLNKTPLNLLKNEYTMCFNRFNLMFPRIEWRPTFYMVTDDLVVKDMASEINNEIVPQVQAAFFPDLHPSNVNFKSYIHQTENVFWLNTDKPEFSLDLPNCGINKTVVNAGLQVAAFLGFEEIYLVGVDVSFVSHNVKKITSRDWEAAEDDPNHFDPRYFEKGRRYHNPTVEEMLLKFSEAKAFFDSRNIKIFNAGIGGRLEVFPRVDFSSLF